MLLIVRLYPKTDLNKLWYYVENEIKNDDKKPYTPLYATQTEGMMDVGLIFDANSPDDLTEFITEEIVKCDEVHHTQTVTLMRPVFFPIPKKKPEVIQRFVVRIFTHPRYYKEIYNLLIRHKYPFNLFPIYISYSLGAEDIIMSLGADSEATVKKFVKQFIRSHDGVNQSSYYPVFRAKRFAPLAKLIAEQKEHMYKGITAPSDTDESFDWIEDFKEYAMLTGAFPGDI